MDVTTTVKQDLCIGCGVCSASCPVHAIQIKWNKFGEYNPEINQEKCIKCGFCYEICPNTQKISTISNIAKELYSEKCKNYNEYLGYYLECQVGHCLEDEKRLSAASGGILSEVLREMLEQQYIDEVLQVVPNKEGIDPLVKFKKISKSCDVKGSSAYYPSELSEVLEWIKKNKGKYAIVALPCAVYAIRKLQKKNKIFKERIKVILSVVCGQLQNKQYTEYLAEKTCININDIKAVNYREKVENRKADNYNISIKTSQNNEKIANKEASRYWSKGYFKHNLCNFCDDIFAECADAVFMDAWLDIYTQDWKGNTIVVSRSRDISQILNQLIKKKTVELKNIEVQDVLTSQKGRVENKRKLIKGRLYFAKTKGKNIERREKPNKEIYMQNKWELQRKLKIQNRSKKLWKDLEFSKNRISIFTKKMRRDEVILKGINFLNRVIKGGQ